MLNQKGFLGPIGDDLPSLIPVLFALAIFFSTFTFTFNIFDSKNTQFDADLAMVRISNVLQSNGYITNEKYFKDICGTLTVPNVRYVAGLTNVMTRWNNPEEFEGFDIFEYEELFIDYDEDEFTTDDVLMCTNIRGEIDEEFNRERLRGRQVLTRIYPLVLEQGRVVRPVHLVVIAWRA